MEIVIMMELLMMMTIWKKMQMKKILLDMVNQIGGVENIQVSAK